MNEKIVALDLGKRKSVACIASADGKEHRFEEIATEPEALHELLARTKPRLLIVEMTAIAYWVHDLAKALNIAVIVTATNGPAWKWKNVRIKTDRSDALKMIKLYLTDQLEPVYVPDPAERAWRECIYFRGTLISQRTSIQNRIRALLSARSIRTPLGSVCWSKKFRARLYAQALPLTECELAETWRGLLHTQLQMLEQVQVRIDAVDAKLDQFTQCHPAVEMLRKEPGVGIRLAETIVAVLVDPSRFRRGRQVACYAGLTPRHWQSGEMSRDGGISKHGNRVLRTLLVEICWLGRRRNPWMQEVYERMKTNCGGRKKTAIVALARRLLIRLWARWRDWTLEQQALPAAC